MSDADSLVRQRTRLFQEFLDSDVGQYPVKIETMLQEKAERLDVNIDDLRKYNNELADNLIRSPVDYFPCLQNAVTDTVKQLDSEYFTDMKTDSFLVGLSGNFGENHVTPRCLAATLLGKMVQLEGIVTKCYEMRCKVTKSVHYCPKTTDQISKTYSDSTSLSGVNTGAVYPRADGDGNPYVTEFGLSVYEDQQRITVQEMPEQAPAGQLPRSIDIVFHSDLVDQVKPGDRVRVTGIYRAIGSKSQGGTNGVFKTMLLANNVEHILRVGGQVEITADDVRAFKNFANKYKGKSFDKLSEAVAPSICGHPFIKKAVLAQLVGGAEKNLDNGTHIRGDINILMIGDPSTAKSQMLRFALNTAPLAIATTGRGSSGVGLTAAVLTDMDTGEKRLEAGAMVLGDRGMVCIDEFDKMSDADRVAIHEVMEQQTVTINKAGIHTSLNARCSVLAAANPIYGQYKRDMSPMENIALPDSLISRFDLLFIVLDEIDPVLDRKISSHVLRNHTFRAANEPDGYVNPNLVASGSLQTQVIDDEDDEDLDTEDSIYQKHNVLLHGSLTSPEDRIISLKFFKKYAMYAKKRKPKLSNAAAQHICRSYASLRDNRRQNSSPITPRTLETLIRLSTSISKVRLSSTITRQDAEQALNLLRFALYGEECFVDENEATFNESRQRVKKHRKKMSKRRASREGGSDQDTEGSTGDDDSNSDNEDEENDVVSGSSDEEQHLDNTNSNESNNNNESIETSPSSSLAEKRGNESNEQTENVAPTPKRRKQSESKSKSTADDVTSISNNIEIVQVGDDVFREFRHKLSDLLANEASKDEIVKKLLVEKVYDLQTIESCLKRMVEENNICISDGIILRV